MNKFIAIILILLGLFMLYFGIANSMIPPAVTGVGFLFIALGFYRDGK